MVCYSCRYGKRVEVLRGPASVLYGGNALAGVINIITKDVDKTSVNLKLSYGSNNTQNHSLYVAGKASDKLDFNVNYEKKKQTVILQIRF